MATNKKLLTHLSASWIAMLAIGYWIGKATGPGSGQSATGAFVSGGGNARELNPAPSSIPDVGAGTALLGFAKRGEVDGSRKPDGLASPMTLSEVKATITALEMMEASPPLVEALKAALARWAQLDPLDAMAYATQVEAPKRRHDAKLAVLRGWGATDPEAALAYIRENPYETDGAEAREAIFAGVAEGDFGVAFRFFEEINAPGGGFGHEAYYAVQDLFLRNDRAVIDWVGSLGPGEVRDRAIWSLMDEWARYDPEAARAWLDAQDGESHRHEAMIELGESWARVDPRAALDWALGIDPSSRSASPVRERIFTRWLQYDLRSAGEYLVTQEPSPQLDRAFELYVERARHLDPEATMAWAESITDASKRTRAMQEVAAVWRDRDRQAFDAYLQASGQREDELGRF